MSAAIRLPIFGPRTAVVAELLGRPLSPEAYFTDTSPWVVFSRYSFSWPDSDWPELWVDNVHDHVGSAA